MWSLDFRVPLVVKALTPGVLPRHCCVFAAGLALRYWQCCSERSHSTATHRLRTLVEVKLAGLLAPARAHTLAAAGVLDSCRGPNRHFGNSQLRCQSQQASASDYANLHFRGDLVKHSRLEAQRIPCLSVGSALHFLDYSASG